MPCPLRGVWRPPREQGGFRADLYRVGVGVAEPLRRGLLGGVGQLAVGIGERAGRDQAACLLHGQRRQASRSEQFEVLPGGGECPQGGRQVAGDLPSALGAFAAARQDFELLAPGRLSALAVEQARGLVAAGPFADADRQLAHAAEQAAAQRLSHTYADAVQVRAEAALLAGRAPDAAQWARHARTLFLGRDNARRAALASLLELRAGLMAGGEHPDALAARAQAL